MEKHGDTGVQYENLEDVGFDAFVESTMKEFGTPGMAVLVVHGDKIFAKGYGFADIERGLEVSPKTLFQTGSTTKSFTAAMAAHLVESPDHPTISWTTPLAHMIPEDFVLDQSTAEGAWATERVTIEDALSHRTGMSRHDMIWINGDPTTRDIVKSLRHLPLQRELRMKFEYNNTMYTAVSHAVENVLKQPFKDLLKEHIFRPLDMHHTVYTVEDALNLVESYSDVELAKGYMWNNETEDLQRLPLTDIAPSKGSGGVISNVLDYSRWVRHLMQPANLNHALSKNAVKQMRTPRSLADKDTRVPFVGPQAYGLGLYSRVYRGREVVQHAGASPGHMSTMVMVPGVDGSGSDSDDKRESDWAVVVFQNTWSLAYDIVAWHLLDKFLGTPKGQYFDMAAASRRAQSAREETMQPGKIFERLFGTMNLDLSLKPTLPVENYEGIYRHVAYHEFKITRLPFSARNSSAGAHSSKEGVQDDKTLKTEAWLSLEPSGSQKSYFSLSAKLHHVSGDWWWAYRTLGPSCWMTDEALKLRFVVEADGKVKGMELQTEPAMPEFLAFFEKK